MKWQIVALIVLWIVIFIVGGIAWVLTRRIKPKLTNSVQDYLKKRKEELDYTARIVQRRIPQSIKLGCSYLKLPEGCSDQDIINREWCKELGIAGVCNAETIQTAKDCFLHGVPAGSCPASLNSFKSRFNKCIEYNIDHPECTPEKVDQFDECKGFGIDLGECDQGVLDKAATCRTHGLQWWECGTLPDILEECANLNIPDGLCHTQVIAEVKAGANVE